MSKAHSAEDLALRRLPNNLEAERSLLGAVLINNAAFDKALEYVQPRDFFRRAHGSIFAAFLRLIDEQRRDVDIVTLKDELARVGELDECGGPAYIAALTDGVPRSSNVASYAQIVREQATLRRVIKLANGLLNDAYDAEKPSQEIITEADRSIIELQRGGEAGKLLDLRETHTALYADLEHRAQNAGKLIGVETGFQSINDLTLGWQPAEMIVVAARPSLGKTALALHTAIAAAKTGKVVGIFSLEMQLRELEWRMLSSLSGVALERLRGGFLGDVDYERLRPAMEEFAGLKIFIDDRSGQDVHSIRAGCRRLRSEHGLDLVIIDYVQLIPGTLDRRGANRHEELTDISKRVKGLAKELQAPVLLLSQLNRNAETRADPRPKLTDLKECSSLEQDADKVIFIHRKHHRESGTTNIILEKDRNGPGGVVNVTFTRDNQQFSDGGEEPVPEPAEEKAERKARQRSIFSRSR